MVTFIFLTEILLKIMASGLIFNGPKSYLRNYANILDFLIIFVNTVSLFS